MKDIYLELVNTSFKMRYKGSILGFLWVLINPFSMFLLLFLFFSKLSQISSGISSSEFGIYLLIGLILFTLFSEGILWGMSSLLEKSEIILKINFPRPVAVASSVSLAVINFLINSILIVILVIFAGVTISLSSLAYLLLVISTSVILIYGLSVYLSVLLIRLRDLEHIVELVLMLLFYGSAIFYPIEIIPDKWQFLILYNPLATLIQAARHAIIYDEIVRQDYVLAILGVSVLILVTGTFYFNRQVKKIAEFF